MENSKVQYTSEMSKFKQKYNTDENFRAKHKNYINTKVACPDCNKLISRSNMSHHRNLKWHQRLIQNKINKQNEEKVQQEIEKLKNIIVQLKNSANTEQYEEVLINV